MFKLEKLKNLDTWFLAPIILLIIIGGLTVFSSTYFFENSPSQLFYNQVLFTCVGIALFFLISILDLDKFNNKFAAFGIVTISTLLLLIVLVFGNTAYGAQRWIDIGPFSIQPSEFAKLFVIFIAAYAFSVKEVKFQKIFNIYENNKRITFNDLKKYFKSETFIKFFLSFVFFVVTVLLVVKQKSLGNSVLITLTYILIIFLNTKITYKMLTYFIPIILSLCVSFNLVNLDNIYNSIGITPKVLGLDIILITISLTLLFIFKKILKLNLPILIIIFILFLPAGAISSFLYNDFLEPYQRQRIETFLNPDNATELAEDYNRQKSLEAIGSSQFFGKGFLKGNIVNSGLLPFAYTDFAYAAYVEQFGFVGAIILIGVYYFLFMKIIFIASNSKSNFTKIIAFGVCTMLILNTLQHIGMNLGVTPITGVPLPLISYGGSSAIVAFIGLGLVNSIYLENLENSERVTKFEMS